MTLATEIVPTITRAGGFSYVFHSPDVGDVEDAKSGTLEVHTILSNGTTSRISFDLLAILLDDTDGTNTHLPALNAIETYLKDRINTEMLGL